MLPHASPPRGPAAAHSLPAVHAGLLPHMQTPDSQRSPCAQQIEPQPGPVVQVVVGWHSVAGFASNGAWHGRAVHVMPLAVQLQSLQSSPAGHVSPSA